jgi:hypothetical protein
MKEPENELVSDERPVVEMSVSGVRQLLSPLTDQLRPLLHMRGPQGGAGAGPGELCAMLCLWSMT